jgi:hypothetical protein
MGIITYLYMNQGYSMTEIMRSSILMGPSRFELEEPAAGLVEEEAHPSQGHSTDGGSLAHGAAVGQDVGEQEDGYEEPGCAVWEPAGRENDVGRHCGRAVVRSLLR